MKRPQIGFVYTDIDGNATVLSFDLSEDGIEQAFQASMKFLAVIFCEENVEDMIMSKAAEIGEAENEKE